MELPEEEGLFIYLNLLNDLPSTVFKDAVTKVMKTHTYRTMPLPGEILSAADDWRPAYQHMQEIIARCGANLYRMESQYEILEKENG